MEAWCPVWLEKVEPVAEMATGFDVGGRGK